MPLAYRTEESSPLVAAYCHGLAGGAVNLNVDARDEMLVHLLDCNDGDRDRALAMYVHSGRLLWSALRQVVGWRSGEVSNVGRLLDFAAGYGRVTRFLVSEIPADRVWVSDIYAEGVRFQEEQLGVHGVVSTAEPQAFDCPGTFDCILACSFFTHLPEATFLPWLARLRGLLAPGGLLAFSVHDESLLPEERALPPPGILFAEVSESGSLAKAQYGTSWVTEGFVRSALAAAAPGCAARRFPRALAGFQDLWVVVDGLAPELSGLALRGEPEGYVERCAPLPPDRLEVSGWTIDRVGGRPPREVLAAVDGRVVGRSGELSPRPDVSRLLKSGAEARGWRLAVPLPAGSSGSSTVLAIRAVDDGGAETVLYAATLDAALLRSVRLELGAAAAALELCRAEAQARLAQAAAATAYEIAVRDVALAAMRASRFWKLRDGWFAVKRRLGLTRDP